MPCRPAFTEEFNNKLGERNYSNIRDRIIEKVKILCQQPLANKTYLLHGNLEGKRSFWVSKKIRIIYAYCRQCRQLKHVKLNGCHDCLDMKDETVVFFTFDYHDRVY